MKVDKFTPAVPRESYNITGLTQQEYATIRVALGHVSHSTAHGPDTRTTAARLVAHTPVSTEVPER